MGSTMRTNHQLSGFSGRTDTLVSFHAHCPRPGETGGPSPMMKLIKLTWVVNLLQSTWTPGGWGICASIGASLER